jgi:hypothetical protein
VVVRPSCDMHVIVAIIKGAWFPEVGDLFLPEYPSRTSQVLRFVHSRSITLSLERLSGNRIDPEASILHCPLNTLLISDIKARLQINHHTSATLQPAFNLWDYYPHLSSVSPSMRDMKDSFLPPTHHSSYNLVPNHPLFSRKKCRLRDEMTYSQNIPPHTTSQPVPLTQI